MQSCWLWKLQNFDSDKMERLFPRHGDNVLKSKSAIDRVEVVRKALSSRGLKSVSSPSSVIVLLQSLVDSDSQFGDIRYVLRVMGRGPEVLGSTNRSGETLLMTAAYHGRLDLVDDLLRVPQARSTIDARDNEGVTALMHASVAGHVKVVQRLLEEESVHLYYKNAEGTTAM